MDNNSEATGTVVEQSKNVSPLQKYTYRFSIKQDERLFYIQMRRNHEASNDNWTAFEYFRMNIFQQHPDFLGILKKLETSSSKWGILGIVTRGGSVIYTENGFHRILCKVFDELSPFLFVQEYLSADEKWSIQVMNNNVATVDHSTFPTYLQYLQAMEFLANNLHSGDPKEDEKRILSCAITVLGLDGKPQEIEKSFTVREWLSFFKNNHSFMENIKDESQPFPNA